jgi:hypothetical protein
MCLILSGVLIISAFMLVEELSLMVSLISRENDLICCFQLHVPN